MNLSFPLCNNNTIHFPVKYKIGLLPLIIFHKDYLMHPDIKALDSSRFY